MTQIRPDKIIFTSLIDTYVNYETSTAYIDISGSLAIGATGTFTATIPYTRGQTRADVYLRNTTTGVKRPISGGRRQSPYSAVSTETCTQLASYSASQVSVSLAVFNGTGAPIVLTSQTIEVTVVAYEVPV